MSEPLGQPGAKPPAGKVFDVRRPGRAPASPTSRPGVMGHTPKAQASQSAVSGVGEAPLILSTKQKIDIKPPAGSENQAPSSPNVGWTPQSGESRPQEMPQPAADFAPAPAPDVPVAQPEPPAPAMPSPTPAPAMPPADDAPVPHQFDQSPAAVPPADDNDPLLDTIAPDLADSPDMVISHHQPVSTGKTILLVAVAVLLAVAALDLMLDANLFSIPAIPHTNFLG